MSSPKTRRGRPKIHTDDRVLEAALWEFAVKGYEGASLRSLNGDLGLSHGTINQRFGTKEQLYMEAVDYGFSNAFAEIRSIIDAQPLPTDPIEELRVRFRAFLIASFRRPYLNRLINNEGVAASPVLDHIYDTYIEPAMRVPRRIIARLAEQGILEPHSDRAILFLLAHGAASSFSLRALSDKFDPLDGPLDENSFADEVVTIVINGMRRHSGR